MFIGKKIITLIFIFSVGFLFHQPFASAACTRQDPTLTFIPSNTVSGAMGAAFTYTVEITNNDYDDNIAPLCVPITYTVNIDSMDPDLVSTSLPVTVFGVNPEGGVKTANFTVTSKNIGLTTGGYSFYVSAIDGIYSSTSEEGIYDINALDVEICSNAIDDDGDGDISCADSDCLSDPFCCGNGNLDGSEVCDPNLPSSCSGATPVCLNDCTGCVASSPGCAFGTGNCDGVAANGCEVDLLTDDDNCGSCGNKCKVGTCVAGVCPSNAPTNGIVPCDRIADNPNTPWVEMQPCTICHLVILVAEIINFIMELMVVITVLMIIISALVHMTSFGDAGLSFSTKSAMSKVLKGFVIILIAWVIINTVMTVFGFKDPEGDNNWAESNCGLGSFTYCGDGIVQGVNDLGETEECESTETLADYQARTGGSIADWAEEVSRCNDSCRVSCKNDPLLGQIGMGCFLASNPCQKGRYVCDLEGGGISCQDIYSDPKYSYSPWYIGDPLYDYCCTGNPSEFADGFVGATNTIPFTVERATWFPFTCQEVCANVGKVCVGVGLENLNKSCIYITHDIGSTCDNPANNTATNCNATFSRRNSCDCTDATGACFGVRETACYCAF